MQLHTRILDLMKEKFPELKLPGIPEGFSVSLCFCITRHITEAGDLVRSINIEYDTCTGKITYVPWLDGFTSAQVTELSLEQLTDKIDWVKSTGTVTVNAAVTLKAAPVTL